MPAMNQSMPPAAAVAAFHHQAHHRVAQPNNSATANNIHILQDNQFNQHKSNNELI